MNPVTVFACESQPIVVEGLAKVLDGCSGFSYAGSAPTLQDALEAARSVQPDILLVEQVAGLKIVFQFMADLKCTWSPCAPVLWVNELSQADSFRAVQMGARGVLKKTLPLTSLTECLQAVGQGEIWMEGGLDPVANPLGRRSTLRLTPREREIVQKVCCGLKNKEIAEALSITAGTVKVHLMHIFEKTGVADRFDLAIQGRRFLGLESHEAMGRLEHVS